MDLKEFVSETLKQLIEGVKAAQELAEKSSAMVNPAEQLWIKDGGTSTKLAQSSTGQTVQLMEFDVAITIAEGSQAKGGAGLAVGPLLLGSQLQADTQNSAVSRIRFSIPVALPYQWSRSGRGSAR